MKFRFYVKQVSGVGPLCADVGSYVAFGTNVVVYIDGEFVMNHAGGFALTTPTLPFTLANGRIVQSVTAGIDGLYTFQIDGAEIHESIDIKVDVSKTGFNPFLKTFRAFGYDLGNNLPSIVHNPAINIFLVPPLKAKAAFATWTRPYTNTQYVYNTSSADGKFYYDDLYPGIGNIITEQPDYIIPCKNIIPIGQHNEVYESEPSLCGCDASESILLEDCETELVLATKYNLLPKFDFTVLSECCAEGNCKLLVGVNQIVPFIDVDAINLLWINDVETLPYEELIITYGLYNAVGELISEVNQTIDLTVPFVPEDNAVLIEVPAIGDYLVKMVVSVPDVFECPLVKEFKGCLNYHIEEIECRKVRIFNYSQNTATIDVQQLNADKEFETLETVGLAACISLDYTFVKDGVYNILVTDDVTLEVKNLIVVINCGIIECLSAHIKELVCNAGCKCGGTCGNCSGKKPYDFNAIMLLAYGYFSLINDEYLNYYVYDILAPNDIERFYEYQQFIDRAIEYCDDCEKPDCGCSKH